MAGVKKTQYVAVVGLDLEGGKKKVRVEPEDDLPADTPQSDIEDLLSIGAIKPKGGDKSESN